MSDTIRRGDTSEHKVAIVLVELMDNPELLIEKGIGVIKRIFHARPNSKLDRMHTDFLVLVETNRGEYLEKVPVPIQVKSSERHRREFEKEMDEENMPHIKCVSVPFGEDLENIREQVIQCLRNAVKLWKDGLRHYFEAFQGFFKEKPEPEEKFDFGRRNISSKELRKRRKDNFHYFAFGRMSH